MVIDCPYSGKVDPVKVKDVTQALLDMGCYEVSLGDTVGTGNPTTIDKLLRTVLDGGIPAADRKSTRLNSSHSGESRMPSSA